MGWGQIPQEMVKWDFYHEENPRANLLLVCLIDVSIITSFRDYEKWDCY